MAGCAETVPDFTGVANRTIRASSSADLESVSGRPATATPRKVASGAVRTRPRGRPSRAHVERASRPRATSPISDHDPDREQGVADEPRTLARAARVAAGGGGRGRGCGERGRRREQRHHGRGRADGGGRAARTRLRRPHRPRAHATPPSTAAVPPPSSRLIAAGRALPARRRAAAWPPSGSRFVRMSGRPRPGRRIGPRVRVDGRDAQDQRVVDAAQEVHAQAGGRRRGRCPSGRGRRGPPAVPTDSRVTTTRPSSSASPSTAMRSRPSLISNGTTSRDRPRTPSSGVPSRSSRRRRRRTSGRSSSSSQRRSAESTRPQDADVPRRALAARARRPGPRARPWWRR